jgi:preprotein translocase SecE subunit
MSAIDRMKAFVQSAWVESKKVTWPTRTELVDSTRVVIVATLAVMAFLFVVDRGLNVGLGLFIR